MRSVSANPICEKLDKSGKFQVSSSDEHILFCSSNPSIELTTWSVELPLPPPPNLTVCHPASRFLPFICTPRSIQLSLLDPTQSQKNHLFHVPHCLIKDMFNFTIYALICKKKKKNNFPPSKLPYFLNLSQIYRELNMNSDFYVLLTVRLSINLGNDQLDAQLLDFTIRLL
jgi:hypothetical protein